MRLKLKIEELAVESFSVDEAPSARGTVRGRESVDDGGDTIEKRTCFITCDGSCDTCPTGMGPACCVAAE